MLSATTAFWSQPMSLAGKFAVTAALVLIASTLVLGNWVGGRIAQGIVNHAGGELALRMESVLERAARDLAWSNEVKPETRRQVETIVAAQAPPDGWHALRIWRRDGSLALAVNDRGSADVSIRESVLKSALEGNVVAFYHPELLPNGAGKLEVYAPVRGSSGGQIVGVLEAHDTSSTLERAIVQAQRQTWLVVGATGLGVLALLSYFVLNSDRTIAAQQERLAQQLAEQKRLKDESEVLRSKLQHASRMATELNERYLRRISSDLHDGPAQHLALSLLKIDEIARHIAKPTEKTAQRAEESIGIVRRATQDAMREVRNISSGLALPELKRISPAEALTIAANAHERATGSRVRAEIAPLPPRLPLPITICLFRFAQEGLNNAFRHGGGNGQTLVARYDGRLLNVEIQDQGPGFDADTVLKGTDRLGLSGLKHRIESLGGTLDIVSSPGRGTKLVVGFENPAAQRSNRG
ncbi:MAG: sensor histidine kinase [Hyphomicrobium sp.]|nr:sensor histidine kinase [Hyphomicrobium sp.]